MEDAVKAKVVGRNALSSHPIMVQVMEGGRVKERFKMTREQALLSEHGPYALDDKVMVVVEGDECRIVDRAPEPATIPGMR